MALWLILGAANAGDSPSNGRLGVLFYSPAERNSIVNARAGIEDEEEEAPPQAGPRFAISGLVKRERGKSTVWINRQPVGEGQPVGSATPPAIGARGIIFAGKPLRVGETIDTTTGQSSDFVPQGTVTVKSAK